MDNKSNNTFCPKSRKDWRKWLQENHNIVNSVWLVYYKSSSSKVNISWSHAVEEALCFGWIDSLKKTIDEERFMQFFSRRKPNSTWSKINKEKVEQLISNGLMTKAGLESIQTAKENGSWSRMDEVEELKIPEDLETAFNTQTGSRDYFLSLNKSTIKAILQWIVLARRPDTRQKRISETVYFAGRQQKPKQFR